MGVANVGVMNVSNCCYGKKQAQAAEGSGFAITLATVQASVVTTAKAAVQGAAADTNVTLDTDKGRIDMNLEDYFTPKPGTYNFDIPEKTPPLILPTANNIGALSNHVSDKFRQFLADNHIPSAPANIRYDMMGQMVLPSDYAYTDQLKKALESDPVMARELSTVHAITSQYAAMEDSIKFSEEYMAATTQAEIDAVLAKYSYLFNNNRHYAEIALLFSADGSMSFTADGKAYNPVGEG